MDEEFIKGLGKKEKKDYTAAIKHFKISATEGNSQALFEIGQIYFYSLSRLAEALSWYRKAVKKHNTDAIVGFPILVQFKSRIFSCYTQSYWA